MKLNKREIDALEAPAKGDRLVFDDELTGFALRITAKNARIFLFQYWRAGKNHRLRLGLYGEITPAAARRLAERARLEVAAGRNPVVERREAAEETARQVIADAFTFEVLISRWEEEGLRDRRPRYRAEAVRALRQCLAVLKPMPARKITASDARTQLTKLGAIHPVMARRVQSYARAAYNWARKQELVDVNPFGTLPAIGRETARERVLSDQEIADVWNAAASVGALWCTYLRVLMLTLQRREEVAGMAWAELSPDLSTWQIPGGRTKNRRAHTVHLVPAARELLAQMPRVALPPAEKGAVSQASPLVFTTTGKTPVSGVSKMKIALQAEITRIREKRAAEAGTVAEPMPTWWLHDFRRTGVTTLARLGVRWEVADRILNHSSGAISGVAAVYQRHEFLDERRAALGQWARHVTGIAAAGRDDPIGGKRISDGDATQPRQRRAGARGGPRST